MTFTHITDIHQPQLKIYHQFREHTFKADGSFVADSPKIVTIEIMEEIKSFNVGIAASIMMYQFKHNKI